MFQTDLLSDQHILVTGGGTGLGRAMALRYSELGAKLSIIGRREGPLESTVAEIAKHGSKAAWASCDVRDPERVNAAVDELENELGPVTALVNNPRTPPGVSTNLVARLQNQDLKRIGTNHDVPELIRRMAKRTLETRTQKLSGGLKKK